MENRFLPIKSIGKKLIVFAVIAVMLLSIPACTFYPDYEWPTWDEEYGEVLDIDGIVYRTLPETLWRPSTSDHSAIKIGKLGSKDSSYGVFTYESDTDRIFVFTEDDSFFADVRHKRFFYRKDVDLPEFLEENITCIAYKKWGDRSGEGSFNNSIEDRQLIEDVFTSFKTPTKQSSVGRVESSTLRLLYFTNSDYKGICIVLSASAYENKYWISIDNTGMKYAEVSQELMEKLVGEELPTAKEYLEQQTSGE